MAADASMGMVRRMAGGSAMTERRFYFQIKAANVIECVQARSLCEAKLIAADTWLEWWSQMEWINLEPETNA
jgi:hypothetical protein